MILNVSYYYFSVEAIALCYNYSPARRAQIGPEKGPKKKPRSAALNSRPNRASRLRTLIMVVRKQNNIKTAKDSQKRRETV